MPVQHVAPEHEEPTVPHVPPVVHTPAWQSDPEQQSALATHVSPAARHAHVPLVPVHVILPQHCASPAQVCPDSKQHAYPAIRGRHDVEAVQHSVAIVQAFPVGTHDVPTQAPERHDCPAAQAFPHAPQFLVSLERTTHAPPQKVRPAAHPQLPPEQNRGDGHGEPHTPQFDGSTARFTHVPPQKVSPAGQVHVAAEHTRGAAQGVPHAPQLAGSVERSTHDAPQSVRPVPAHGRPHVPPLHTRPAPQTVPHAPQWAALVSKPVSHPFAVMPSQSPKPAVHAVAHAPVTHVAVVFGVPSPGHMRPHAPQLRGSLCNCASQPFTALPSQFAKPALQAARSHAPAAQRPTPFAGAHARPHAPQFAVLLVGSVSQPFEGSPSQFANPVVHAPITHDPVEHAAPAWAKAHAFPHIPQLARLLRVSASQPFAGLPSQSPAPAVHASAQRPATHDAVALVPPGHTVPHPPQFMGSVAVETQRVPQTVVCPGGQAQCPAWQVEPPPQVIPHAPQFARSENTSTHVPLQVWLPSSTTPLQSSSMRLHGVSVAAVAVQSHTVPRPGRPTQCQFEEVGQSVAPAQVREQRPLERQMPEAHSTSLTHRAPNAPGMPVSTAASTVESIPGASSRASAGASEPPSVWAGPPHDARATKSAARPQRANKGVRSMEPPGAGSGSSESYQERRTGGVTEGGAVPSFRAARRREG